MAVYGDKVKIWGIYNPKDPPQWLTRLKGKSCEIITEYQARMIIRIYNSGWGIKGGLIVVCPCEHVKVIGSIE